MHIFSYIAQRKSFEIIAGTNIISALFMVLSGAFVLALKWLLGFSMAKIFISLAILNGFLTYLIFHLLPADVLRSILRYLFKLFFKAKVEGIENLNKTDERTIIIANHSSLLDAPLIVSMIDEKVTFAIYTGQAEKVWLKPFLKIIDTISIDPHNPMAVKSLIKCVGKVRKL